MQLHTTSTHFRHLLPEWQQLYSYHQMKTRKHSYSTEVHIISSILHIIQQKWHAFLQSAATPLSLHPQPCPLICLLSRTKRLALPPQPIPQLQSADSRVIFFFFKVKIIYWFELNYVRISYKLMQNQIRLLIRNMLGIDLFTFNSSTSTFRNRTLGVFLASSARTGAMKRHGPHHEAVKSTTTYNATFLVNGIFFFKRFYESGHKQS